MNTPSTARLQSHFALPRVGMLVRLFKLRIVGLLVLASIAGALLASDGRLAIGDLGLLVVTGAMSSAGASALNQYLERERDEQMRRTRGRPLARSDSTNATRVLVVSLGLVVLSFVIVLPINQWLALFLALGALIYVGVYTVWLKPRTALNIVFGGAAGSCAVLSGSAAVGNWAYPPALGLALLIFVWTPVHFWSLAQAYREDYMNAGVPMLPTITNPNTTAMWIVLNTAITAFIALLLSIDPKLGWLYLVPVVVATVWLAHHAWRLMRQPVAHAMEMFKVSNIYLGLVLLAIFLGTWF